MKTDLKQLSKAELTGFMEHSGQPPYRVNQIIKWIYKKTAASFDKMTDLSKDFREELKAIAVISNLSLLQRQVSEDGTQKFLFELKDGETIESVLMPNSKGRERFTLCISSQAGCATGCKFCMTGRLGLKRNLKASEIVDQVITVKRHIETWVHGPEASITNIVFMGMGEPLNNFNEVVRSLRNITGLMGFSKRRITVSTAGIVPGIRKLAYTGPDVNLAVSLNAATDRIRDEIMPVNKKYPLNKLIKACKEFPLSPNRRITFEYVMLGGINDSTADADRLVKLLSGIKSKVNLIPYNPLHKSIEFNPPLENKILRFQKTLRKAGLTVIIRKSKGSDISAACGQLKASYS
ncbi:MAG TPA: 23S rRNA (adenine(2503)-C(2))-methyltransferase RlmN [Nitrospirae bacterium]|nr:putative dual-specificity RNA methyltransferase RlmN [bacterium BMS3Abin06]HDH13076.1 23S rRNA (adenine(2503)-C(2))-methyltransferase RlmN [Nitrospirota bacterium]HDZ02904.1 23S rRNA (adenine(2503)-C(2))-methyltransferase RlmN [Nitrospirota bacterium]